MNKPSAILSAKGDGISDDQEPLQRALDAGPTLLEIPTGHYKVGGTLRIRGGTRLRPETRMENFVIQDFHRVMAGDKCPGQPTLRVRHVAARRLVLQPGNVDRTLAFGDAFECCEADIQRFAVNEPDSR